MAGGNAHPPISITTDSAASAILAQNLLRSANAGIVSGLWAVYYPGEPVAGNVPSVLQIPSTVTGGLASAVNGSLLSAAPSPTSTVTGGVASVTSAQTKVVFDAASNETVYGGIARNLLFIAGTNDFTYFSNIGTGSVYAFGGNDAIYLNTPTKPHHKGDDGFRRGPDQFVLTTSGNDTIYAQSGYDKIVLGSGNDVVSVTGATVKVYVGTGSDTVDLTSGRASIYLAHKHGGDLTLVNTGGAATVFGGDGSVTVDGSGGLSGSLYHGGSDGDNFLLSAKKGSTTLFGGGSGDTLTAQGTGRNWLIAGTSNETLVGGGTGHNTLTGAHGGDTFLFVKGQAGGEVEVTNFIKADTISLVGYGSSTVAAISHIDVHGHGYGHSAYTTVTLNDGTTIKFDGVTHPTTITNSIKLS